MDKGLVKSLLKIYHSTKSQHTIGKSMREFVEIYQLGHWYSTTQWTFTQQDKTLIAQLLAAEAAIDAENTTAERWDGLSRSASLGYGTNEKMSDLPVRGSRVAVKSLLQNPLLLDGSQIYLPKGANLDVEYMMVATQNQHQTVLLVENWEVFEKIHAVNIDLSQSGCNPLVVFRGCPYIYQQDAVCDLLKKLSLPVYAFVDFDPSGLLIANSLPYFAGLIKPSNEVLLAALQQAKNQQRYAEQLPMASAILDRTIHPEIAACWLLLKQYGCALPQEYFVIE